MVLNYGLHDTTITLVNPCSRKFHLLDISRTFNTWLCNINASSYKWNALHPGFSSSVSIILIARCLLAVFFRNTSFLSWISMSNSIYRCYRLWLDPLVSHQNNTSTPKIWKSIVDVLQSSILPPDVFLPQNQMWFGTTIKNNLFCFFPNYRCIRKQNQLWL